MIKIGDKVRFMVKYDDKEKIRYGCIKMIDYKNDMCIVVENLSENKYFWNIPIKDLYFDDIESCDNSFIKIGDKVTFMGYYNGENKIRIGTLAEKVDDKVCVVVENLPFGHIYRWYVNFDELNPSVKIEDTYEEPQEDEYVVNNRLSWDEYFIEILKIVSQRSSCLSRQVGAVIVKDNRILATGYNGSPSGVQSCYEKGYCIRKNSKSGENLNMCFATHAEENAILQCAKFGISCDGATIYITCFPCERCMKSIIQSGIKEVVYINDYNDEISKSLANLSQITIRRYGDE